MKLMRALLFLMAFVVLGFGFYEGIFKSDFLKLSDIEVSGATPDVEARVRKNLKAKIGDSFWKINLEQEASILKQDLWIESLEMRRRLPSKLQINIVQRKPVAAIGDGKGRFKFVDNQSVMIDEAKAEDLSDLPILFGVDLVRKQELRAQAIDILKTLPDDGLISKQDVSELQFDDEHGFRLTLSKTRMTVDLGKENIPLRLDRARRVAQYLESQNIDALRIDSDYAKKVLVKVRKDR